MHSFRLSTALMLTATCLLLTAEASTESLTICDDNFSVQRLSCDSGVIQVQQALYGRADRVTCSEGRSSQQLANTRCSQRGTVDVLKRRCDGKKVCELNSDVVRTSDPCYGTSKYLQTNFTCFPAIHRFVCENSFTSLRCDVGQVINVYGAHFGRLDPDVCSFQRPLNELQNVHCSRPVNKVAERCNGRNSCTVKASKAEFGDPCYGTYKYLEVAYTCQYPV
ncbi:L-rhamnose-binding lectin SML-like [Notolabrus celidotus]|uniref:L-rhamnose-binding lectin SML-like n=1 Tax=Notolabrus celidotus TaxID=1203425 RepID=UPI00148F826F|nr:L-rhamnose-binding lectin SML-like [Notolabrus celidotus]